jgi:hypothetical protein
MIDARTLLLSLPAIALMLGSGSSFRTAHAQTKQEEAEALAAPAADVITAELLDPAVRQAVANGVASLIARMTAEGNEHGLAYPPAQTMKLVEMVEVPAKRVSYEVAEQPIYEHEYAEVEKIVPVMESGQPTGRFTKARQRVVVRSWQVGKTPKRTGERLVPDKDGTETMKVPKYGPGGPAAWAVNLPGLNGMALYVLVKAGLAKHPATVKHAEVLAEHANDHMGLPDRTFDLAWMAAGFASLGSGSRHEPLARRLVGKLIDGQVREKGDLDGLWGPVCVNYGYFGKLMTLGQTVRQEIDIHIPKKMEIASPAEQEQLVAMGREMKAFANLYDRTHRDVFRAGTRMLEIESGYTFEDLTILPGLPFNAYQWVVTDIESTDLATFALAVANQAGLLPKQTERLAIRRKGIHPPVKTEAAIKAAAKRMAAAIDDDGGSTALALVSKNTGYDKTGFPAPSFSSPDAMPSMFDFETACTTLAAEETLESLLKIDPAVEKQLAEPRKRARDRAAKIAARWYVESANPAAEPWKGMYAGMKVSHADLTKSGVLPVPAMPDAVESLPWGPQGCLYRIVPDFRGLFTGVDAKKRFGDDLFRQIAFRLVAMQDQNGQWATTADTHLNSTASESLAIGRIANSWHKSFTRDPPVKINVPDPVGYDTMLHHGHYHHHHRHHHHGAAVDAATFPTLASLLFLLEATDGPVKLDGIAILPEPSTEPAKEADADKQPARLTPIEAARRVVRPNLPRQELFDAIIASRWPRKTVEPPPAATKPARDAAEKPAAGEEKEPEEDDGLGKFEDLLQPAAGK